MQLMSTVTSKGQTTVPSQVRKALGIAPRQKIIYEIEGDSVRLRAAGGSLMQSAGVLASDEPALPHKEERAAYRKARAAKYTRKS